MPTLVTRFVLHGEVEEIPPVRHAVVEQVRSWVVLLDDETAQSIAVVTSELVANAVVHAAGRVTVSLRYRPGRLLIAVFDSSALEPVPRTATEDDESGRGTQLIDLLAFRTGWERTEQGKRVWAELELPEASRTGRSAVLRGRFRPRLSAKHSCPACSRPVSGEMPAPSRHF